MYYTLSFIIALFISNPYKLDAQIIIPKKAKIDVESNFLKHWGMTQLEVNAIKFTSIDSVFDYPRELKDLSQPAENYFNWYRDFKLNSPEYSIDIFQLGFSDTICSIYKALNDDLLRKTPKLISKNRKFWVSK